MSGIRDWLKDDFNRILMCMSAIGLLIVGRGYYQIKEINEEVKRNAFIQKSEVIIPNTTRDNYIDKKELSDVLDLTDFYINEYNKTGIKITSRADLNGDQIISQIERDVLHNKIDSVIASYNYNTKNETFVHRNNIKSTLDKLIHAPIEHYNLNKIKD